MRPAGVFSVGRDTEMNAIPSSLEEVIARIDRGDRFYTCKKRMRTHANAASNRPILLLQRDPETN